MIEGTRKRTQVFEGIVIARQGSGARETFTVRKQSFGVGVERTFPVHSPKIERLEVVARGDVRRAKLYYLRGRVGKRARVAERRWGIEDDLVIAEAAEPVAVDSEGVAQEEAEPELGGGDAEEARTRRRAPRRRPTRRGAGGGGRRGDGWRERRADGRVRRGAADESEHGGRGPGIRRRGRGFRGIQLIPKPTTGRGAAVELVIIVALAIGLALGIQAFVVKPYQIPSESMEPTLDVGQRVLVNRVFDPARRRSRSPATSSSSTRPRAPSTATTAASRSSPGQPCPSRPPELAEENFIKRVVAGPGDTLSIEDGIPIVNGEPFEGDWEIRPCRGLGGCDFPEEITIPPDHYFMMGDNRGASDDSRYWGPVPRDWIIGEAFFTYWPPNRIGFL